MQVAFPLKKGMDGYFMRQPDYDSIKGRLIQLLLTNPNERVGMPAFGVGIKRFLFQPLDMMSMGEIKDAIRSQLVIFEPSLQPLGIDIWSDYKAQPPLVYIRLAVRDVRRVTDMTFDFSIKYRNPLFK